MKIAILSLMLFGVPAAAATASEVTVNATALWVVIYPQGTPGFTPTIPPGTMEVGSNNQDITVNMNCAKFVTETPASSDPDRLMFHLLVAAAAAGKKVSLGISNDPKLAAVPGRCSLKWVGILE